MCIPENEYYLNFNYLSPYLHFIFKPNLLNSPIFYYYKIYDFYEINIGRKWHHYNQDNLNVVSFKEKIWKNTKKNDL